MSSEPTSTRTEKAGSVSGRQALLDILSSRAGDHALFLDIDGTLLDLAGTPDGIDVPADLPSVLEAVSRRLGGALALVTGRGLSYAERLFEPLQLPIAGLHGAERRNPNGRIDKVDVPPEFTALRDELSALAASWQGVLIEDKGAAMAAHYRMAPDRKDAVEHMMEEAVARLGDGWKLQRGKMVVEIRPASADKGHAVEAFLAQEPFIGRLPVTIGDDVTDEAMFKIARPKGGLAIRVGELTDQTVATLQLDSAEELRTILRQAAS